MSKGQFSASVTRLFVALVLAQAVGATQVCTTDDDGTEHCENANQWTPSLIASCVSIPLAVLAMGLYLFTYWRKRRQQRLLQPAGPQRQLSTGGMDASQIQGPQQMNEATAVRASLDMAQRGGVSPVIAMPASGHLVSAPRVAAGTTYEVSYDPADVPSRNNGSFKKNMSPEGAREAALKAKYPFDAYSNTRPPPPSTSSEMV